MKHLVVIVVIAISFVLGIPAHQNQEASFVEAAIETDVRSAFAAEAPLPSPMIEGTPQNSRPICDNYEDMQSFEEPLSIVWIASMDGCLVSCWGASFTRISTSEKYPRFAAYYSDDSSGVPEEFLADGLVLKVYGKWTGIDADHPRTVFENKCVPTVEIDRIEVAGR